MASIRGILNIQSLNELTSENVPKSRLAWSKSVHNYPKTVGV